MICLLTIILKIIISCFKILGRLCPGESGPGQLGPGQLGPGPNCPGPNCPPLKNGQLGPGQLGPGPNCPGPNCPGPSCPGPDSPGPNLPRIRRGAFLYHFAICTSLHQHLPCVWVPPSLTISPTNLPVSAVPCSTHFHCSCVFSGIVKFWVDLQV